MNYNKYIIYRSKQLLKALLYSKSSNCLKDLYMLSFYILINYPFSFILQARKATGFFYFHLLFNLKLFLPIKIILYFYIQILFVYRLRGDGFHDCIIIAPPARKGSPTNTINHMKLEKCANLYIPSKSGAIPQKAKIAIQDQALNRSPPISLR